jgi:predicted acylesterase/phospholipase RssA
MTATALDRPQRLATGGASSPRMAFVLSGGAGLGPLQVGMLEALYERGITPDFQVGTSVGALNAAFVASWLQSPQAATELGRVWARPSAAGRLPGQHECVDRRHVRSPRPSGVGPRAAATDPQVHPVRGPRDAAIPLDLVTFDLIEGRELLLSEGPAVEAIAASASIPGIFPPMALGERRLIDGGVSTTRRSPTRSSSAPSASTSCRRKRRTTDPRASPRARSTRPSRESICSWAVGLRPTSPGTRQRPS